jgi:hypothetical protein
MTRNGHAMRSYPSGDRGKTSVLVRDRLPTVRSDTVTQRVGHPFTPALASFGDRVDCGHGRWDEHREQDDQKDYGDREHECAQLSPPRRIERPALWRGYRRRRCEQES